MATERADSIKNGDIERKQVQRNSEDSGTRRMLYQGYFGSVRTRSPRPESLETPLPQQSKREVTNRPRDDSKQGGLASQPSVEGNSKRNYRKKKNDFWSRAGTGPIRGDKLAQNELPPEVYEEKKVVAKTVTILQPSSSSNPAPLSVPIANVHPPSSSDRIVTTTTLSLQTPYPQVTGQSNVLVSQSQVGAKKRWQKKGKPPQPQNPQPQQLSPSPPAIASTITTTTLQPNRPPIVSSDNQISLSTTRPVSGVTGAKLDGRKQPRHQKQRNTQNPVSVAPALPPPSQPPQPIPLPNVQVILETLPPPDQNNQATKSPSQQERKHEQKQEQKKNTPKQRPQKHTKAVQNVDFQQEESKTNQLASPQSQPSKQIPQARNPTGPRAKNSNQSNRASNSQQQPPQPQVDRRSQTNRNAKPLQRKAEFQKDFVVDSSFSRQHRITNAEVRQRQAQASSIYSRKLPTTQPPGINTLKSSLEASPQSQELQQPQQERQPRQQRQQRERQRHQPQAQEQEQPARSAPPPRFSSRELWQANRPAPKQDQLEQKQRNDSIASRPSSQTSSRSPSPSSQSSRSDRSRTPSRSRSRSASRSSREESPASSRSASPDSRSSNGRGRRRRRGSRESPSRSPEKPKSGESHGAKIDQSGHERKGAIEDEADFKREAKAASSMSVAQTTALIKEYVIKFASKVQREMEEEKRHVLERLAKWPLEKLVQEGLAIQGMRAEAFGQHMGKVIVRLQWLFAVPFHRFVAGDHMVLSRVDPLKETPIHALLLEATAQEIRVLISDVTPNLFTGLWRIDKGYSTIVYERIHRVLGNMNLYPKGDAIPLVNVFLQPDRPFGPSTVFSSAAISWAKDTLTRVDAPSRRGKRESEDWGLHSCQLRAAANAILSRFSVIYGPPGTGKTHTLCHFIKLITSFKAPLPILACAKTNAGADHLLELLIQLGLRVVRVGQPQREELKTYALENAIHKHPLDASVEQELKHLVALKARQKNFHAQFSRDRDLAQIAVKTQYKKVREIRSRVMKEILADIQVVCATACGSQDEELEGVRFPVVVIDDASQLSEPETLLVVHRAHHAVLAGDPCQLRVTIPGLPLPSSILPVSFFERAQQFATFLSHQFRMHPMLFAFPNAQFYQNKASSAISAVDRPLPEGFPASTAVTLISHVSREDNAMEQSLGETPHVLRVINALIAADDVGPKEIGVITPHLAQVVLLSRLLTEQGQGEIEVKTVDGFQGREKDVIILICAPGESGHKLNVAITRARRGLILIGDCGVLKTDPSWSAYLTWLKEERLLTEGGFQRRVPARPAVKRTLLEFD